MTPEEERIALEQASLAAAPLSRPEPVWAGSAASDIDFANATAPATRSYAEPGMPASSFMNADVAPTGEVISGSYDSTQDNLRNMKAQEMAMRYKGQQLYASLIQGGATPAEALRASGHLIFYNDPMSQVKAGSLVEKNKPQAAPEFFTDPVTGQRFYRNSKGGIAHVPTQKAAMPKFVGGKISPEVKQQDDIIAKDIAANRSALQRGYTWGTNESGETVRVALTPREKLALQQKIDDAEKRRMELVAPGGHLKEEFNPKIDQNEWAKIAPAWRGGAGTLAPVPNNIPDSVPPTVTVPNERGGFTIQQGGTPTPAPAAAPAPKKELTREVAAEFLKAANGDKAKARKLATDAGYVL